MGDFNAKVGKKRAGDHAVGEIGIAFRNARRELLVEFAERNKIRIYNTFYRERTNHKWTCLSPNGEAKIETYFIPCAYPAIKVADVAGETGCSDLKIVRARI